jgi:putative tryptophan/tyrosine transport system substrate-binding protein
MRRREFITLIGGATLVWPFGARAEQLSVPVVGYLSSGSPAAFAPMVAALLRGLCEAGAVEGKSFTIDFRWADGQYDRLPSFADDFVRREVAVIVATGGTTRC